MDLRQLRYFIALNEHRSFVRAADAMGITQPAFSRSIQGLEHEFGCVLVDRGHKDLRPTPEGQVVLEHALRLVKGAALLTCEVQQMSKLDAGELRFGCGPAPAARLVPDAVADFARRHPRIRTSFEVNNWERLSRSLGRDDIEFFVADIRHFESDPNYHTQPLQPRRGLFFVRPEHPLTRRGPQTTQAMFEFPLASALMPQGIRKLLANLSGEPDFRPTIETEHFSSLLRIVCNTDAIGVGSLDSLGPALEKGEVVQIRWKNLPQDLDGFQARCGIVSRAGYRLSPAARTMIDTLFTLDQPPLAVSGTASH